MCACHNIDRYFKLGFNLHEVKNAVLIFPSVVLDVCRRLGLQPSPTHKITLVEVPRVATDCIQDIIKELEEQRRMSRQASTLRPARTVFLLCN
jgi:hypothetical protein